MLLKDKLKAAVRQILLENKADPDYRSLYRVNIWSIALSALEKGDVIYFDERNSANNFSKNARFKKIKTRYTTLRSPNKKVLYKIEIL